MTSLSPIPATEARQWKVERSERSESRSSSRYVPLNHAGVVQDTLDTVLDGVNATTELIRRKHNESVLERKSFQTEMEVTGSISVDPSDDWLSTRLTSISTEDMQKELSKVKDDQKQNAVTDTLAALVYDIDATAEVLRKGSLKKKKKHEELEYKLRITPGPEEEVFPFPSPRPRRAQEEDNFTVEHVSRDYGVEMSESQTSSLKKRARSETPRRTINVEGSPPPSTAAVCAFCCEEIDGPIITALAPNSYRAQKFHPYHFMCAYCQKALNLRGTYREHDRKPYCHECFYRLYNGLIYAPDEKQAKIQKLI